MFRAPGELKLDAGFLWGRDLVARSTGIDPPRDFPFSVLTNLSHHARMYIGSMMIQLL